MIFSFVNSKGTKYFLNKKEVQMRNNRVQTIYFFSKDERPETGLEAVPDGYKVKEGKTGLPVLQKAQ